MKRIHLVILSLLFLAASSVAQVTPREFTPELKLRAAEQIIERFYADTVNSEAMVEDAIRAMLKTLDPHSTYTDSAATRALTEPLEGNFSGIGIQFNMLTDTIYVIQTVAGGPSERVGILAGDRIIMVDDTLVAGVKKPQQQVVKMLRGPKGSKVNVKVKRPGVMELIDFTITRDDIPITSVDAAYMVDDRTGYVKLARFGETTADEMADAIKRLRKKGMRNLIIDLEGNGGGYLGAAVRLAGMFLPSGSDIVATSGLRQEEQRYTTNADGILTDGRIVVMVDQNSASASEILAGALQDNDRAVIVGRRTFGKGLVQRAFPFPDGSMMRLTTAHYYTPSGRSIQKPYKRGADTDDYYRDIANRLASGELTNADSVHLPDSLMFRTLRLGRPVYGGGGVMPDRFVPLDTAFFTPYYRDMVAKGLLNRYAQGYADIHRKELRRAYRTVEAFDAGFSVSDAMMAELAALGIAEKVEPDPDDLARSREYMRSIIKALIARDIFDMEGYYRISNSLDPVYTEALRLATDADAYRAILPD